MAGGRGPLELSPVSAKRVYSPQILTSSATLSLSHSIFTRSSIKTITCPLLPPILQVIARGPTPFFYIFNYVVVLYLSYPKIKVDFFFTWITEKLKKIED